MFSDPYGPVAALAGIYLLSAVITQPMSNAAAIVLIVPIALDTAFELGANYKTFTMAVVIGAATSFLSPVGHKANVLVFGPGEYKFMDYARVGALLTVILLIVSMIFLPIFWPPLSRLGTSYLLDFVHLVDKKEEQDKLISTHQGRNQMLILPSEIMTVLMPFTQAFSARVWDWAQTLLVGAILAPGRRTVTAALRVLGLKDDPQYQNYHRVLNRAHGRGCK